MRITWISALFINLLQCFDIAAATDMVDSNLDSDVTGSLRSGVKHEEHQRQEAIDETVMNLNDLQDVKEMDESTSWHQNPLLLFSNKCDEGLIDLCEDGSTCAGLKHVFLELCYEPDEEMTDCSSDCAFLLAQLKKEASNQGKALECVYYVQKLPSKCAEKDTTDDDNFFEGLDYSESCPSEDAFTSDLNPGEYEMIHCDELFPSGVFGTGPTYRYCMVGGVASIYTTDTCMLQDDDMEVHMNGDRRMTSFSSKRQLDDFEYIKDYIKDGAEKTNSILLETTKLLDSTGKAFETLETIGKIGQSIGPFFQAFGIAFSIANYFIGEGPSAELLYMQEQFQIVNQKLDLIQGQLEDVQDRIVYELYQADFQNYKANLETCATRLSMFHNDPKEGTRDLFYDGCCAADRSPLTFVNWISNTIDQFLSNTAKSTGYKMDTFLKQVEAIVHSTTTAFVFESACLGAIDYHGGNSLDIMDKVVMVLWKVFNAIEELPQKYINLQLEKDAFAEVLISGSTDECRDKLFDTINEKMNGWRLSPKASVYCYNPVRGYESHGVYYYHGNEYYGFYFGKRIHDKFTVGIDWSYASQNIDEEYSAFKIEKMIDEDFSSDLVLKDPDRLHDTVAEHMKAQYDLELRTVAYVRWGNALRCRRYPDRVHFMNIPFRDQYTISLIFSTFPKNY